MKTDTFYNLNKLSKEQQSKLSKFYHDKFVEEFAEQRPDCVERGWNKETEEQWTIFLFHKLMEAELKLKNKKKIVRH